MCVFGVVFLLTRILWAEYEETVAEGRGVSSQLDFMRDPARLPGVFQLAGISVVFLPTVRHLVRTNRFGLGDNNRELDKTLVRAGLRPFLPPESLLSLSLLLSVMVGLLMSLSAFILDFGPVAIIFGFLSGSIAGYAVPPVALNQHLSERLSLIEKRLPFAIEFMLLTMEANAAFTTAMEVYCEQFENDPLADELRLTLSDINRGASMQDALTNLERRVGCETLSSFVLATSTGIETGQPIKEVLEIQASVVRQRRYEAAEEIAKKASTKATFPLFLIVLAILLLLLAPVVINLSSSAAL